MSSEADRIHTMPSLQSAPKSHHSWLASQIFNETVLVCSGLTNFAREINLTQFFRFFRHLRDGGHDPAVSVSQQQAHPADKSKSDVCVQGLPVVCDDRGHLGQETHVRDIRQPEDLGGPLELSSRKTHNETPLRHAGLPKVD